MTYSYILVCRIQVMQKNQNQNQGGIRKYVFLNTAAPSKYADYRNLAIIECDPDHTPRMIRETRKGNAHIIDATYNIHVGTSARSEGYILAQFMTGITRQLNEHEKSMEEEE